MASEDMKFDKSIYSEIRGVKGPFRPDPNISVALITFSDGLWILNRPFVGEPDENKVYGVMKFQDVRVFRVRAYNTGCMIDDNDHYDSINCWGVEIDDSEYLRESILNDQQRTKEALENHHHYVVYDCMDRVIEVIAKNVVTSIIECSALIGLKQIFDSELKI